jgi:hypothetical protein
MKRILLLAGAMALVLALLSLVSRYQTTSLGAQPSAPVPPAPAPAGEGVPPPSDGPPPPATPVNWGNPVRVIPPTPAPSVKKPAKPASVVEELVAILNETKSTDTFLATLAVLVKFGKEARAAVPAIVRNADRLAVFTGFAGAGDEGKTAREVVETIYTILDGENQKLATPGTAR